MDSGEAGRIEPSVEPTAREFHAAEIARLQRRYVVELEPMVQLHRWLDGKRLARQACRIMEDSRTGKTLSATRWLRQCL